VGILIGLLFLAFMVYLLVAILRFTIVSERRTRGAEGRLRYPNATEVAGIVGFPPPADLVAFYERAPFLDRKEFQLVDPTQEAGRAWDIGEFIPLTARDAREASAISSVKQLLPIAWDMDKGVYVVTPAGAVLLVSPNVPGRQVRVAANVREFETFEPRDMPLGESE
jgi:hypothetical protein